MADERNERPYARVPRGLWDDPRFLGLSDTGKLFYVLLVTRPGGHSSGICRATVEGLAGDVRWSMERTRAHLLEVTRTGLVRYSLESRNLLIEDVLADFPPANPKMVDGWSRHVAALPSCPLRGRWSIALKRITAHRPEWHRYLDRFALDEVLATAEQATPPTPPKLAGKVEKRDLPAEAIAGWNAVTGHKRSNSKEMLRLASGRLRDGRTVEDLVLIAEWAKNGPRAAFFAGDNDNHVAYLRPETLWAPVKFESYLDAARAWKAGGELPSSARAGGAELVSAAGDDAAVQSMQRTVAARPKPPKAAPKQQELPDFD